MASSSARQAKQALGTRLRELRVAAGLTGDELARLMGRHPSKVSRIEHGRAAPSPDDVRQWCLHCDAPDRVADLVASLEAVEGLWVEWERLERTGLRAAQESVLPLWQRTHWFRAYSSWLIPGAVQTPGYTRAVLAALRDRRQVVDDLDDAVAVRVEKQRIIYDASRRFGIVIEESVLRHRIGGADTMTAQLGHLISVAALPSVSLGVIPLDADRSAVWPVESFWLFDEEEASVELVVGHLKVNQPSALARYAQVFASLAELAVHGPAARTLLVAAIEAIDGSI